MIRLCATRIHRYADDRALEFVYPLQQMQARIDQLSGQVEELSEELEAAEHPA